MSDTTGQNATEDWEILIRFNAPEKLAKRIKKEVFEALPQPMIPWASEPEWFSMWKVEHIRKF